MSSVFATALLAANFTIYPVFGDNVQPSQRVAETTAHIEAATDLGLIVEYRALSAGNRHHLLLKD